MVPESLVPGKPVINPGKTLLGIGGIAGDEIEMGVFQGNQTAFCIQFFHADTIGNGQRLIFGKDCGTGIAFLFRVIPELLEGFFRSISWCATFRSPQTMTGFS